MKQYYVYILASKPNGVLYVGLTSNLIQRTWQHRTGITQGFSQRYFVKRLVYFECHCDIQEALKREKLIKRWKRDWKCHLIEENNPAWRDLFDEICA